MSIKEKVDKFKSTFCQNSQAQHDFLKFKTLPMLQIHDQQVLRQ